MKKLILSTAIAALLLPLAAKADSPAPNQYMPLTSGGPERCVNLRRIEKMDVVDNRSILFYMKGKQIYLNDLPYNCNGLTRHKTVMYRTSLSELCNVDIITVLNSIGSGFLPGPSCGLGQFYPISKENAEKIKQKSRQ
ncbi:DUF6491 family protein [Zhongshania aquimaris]|uniref:Uncharacterized protein n=1 Tax=Zhongshania aquimaris TaxID=2857107 RepID=A0ABS6VTS3_9GAMM|nr:DUF6491 family protein [Zhongshania aquimaris]MBW2941717.1 hypothetical protein [Zhongshania aquimaris]